MRDAAANRNPASHSASRRELSASFIPSRVLVKEVNWLGDLVISLPALRAVRAAFETAKLEVLVRQELAGFFAGMNWIDEIIPYTIAPGIGGTWSQLNVVREIRRRQFDLAILFPNSFRSAFWAILAGVPRRAGYATDGRGLILTHRAKPAPEMMNNHQAHYWLGMVRDTMGIRPVADSAHYVLEIETKSLVRMREWVTQHRVNRDVPLIAIAPAAAYGPAKEWPPVRFSALIDVLADHYHAECVLIGSSAERAQCEQIAATAASGAIIAAGETNVAELIALLSLCDGFAGNDSGAMHLAAALGIPTVGIFGSTDPGRTGPTGAKAGFIFHRIECAPCFARTCRFGHYECLRRVSPEEVANALATLGACTKSASKI